MDDAAKQNSRFFFSSLSDSLTVRCTRSSRPFLILHAMCECEREKKGTTKNCESVSRFSSPWFKVFEHTFRSMEEEKGHCYSSQASVDSCKEEISLSPFLHFHTRLHQSCFELRETGWTDAHSPLSKRRTYNRSEVKIAFFLECTTHAGYKRYGDILIDLPLFFCLKCFSLS